MCLHVSDLTFSPFTSSTKAQVHVQMDANWDTYIPADPAVFSASGQDPTIPLIANSFCGHAHRYILTHLCFKATSPTCHLSGLILDSDHIPTHAHTGSSHWHHRCKVPFEPWPHCNHWTWPPHQTTHAHCIGSLHAG